MTVPEGMHTTDLSQWSGMHVRAMLCLLGPFGHENPQVCYTTVQSAAHHNISRCCDALQVEKQLDAVVTAGLLQRDDFNDRIMAALRGMQVSSAPTTMYIW